MRQDLHKAQPFRWLWDEPEGAPVRWCSEDTSWGMTVQLISVPVRLLPLNEIANGFGDLGMFQPPSQFGIFGLTKSSQHREVEGVGRIVFPRPE
jgi:hypothetical protein